jgi:hypothetical protein
VLACGFAGRLGKRRVEGPLKEAEVVLGGEALDMGEVAKDRPHLVAKAAERGAVLRQGPPQVLGLGFAAKIESS